MIFLIFTILLLTFNLAGLTGRSLFNPIYEKMIATIEFNRDGTEKKVGSLDGANNYIVPFFLIAVVLFAIYPLLAFSHDPYKYPSILAIMWIMYKTLKSFISEKKTKSYYDKALNSLNRFNFYTFLHSLIWSCYYVYMVWCVLH